MEKPVLSIGIIFKNEIRCLDRCLKSLQPLRDALPCELVMADTGSGDGSREVAERYADILFDFPWINDFAAARKKVRQIKEDEFKKWRYEAIHLRDDCEKGKLTVEEYTQWMEDYFPNRKKPERKNTAK